MEMGMGIQTGWNTTKLTVVTKIQFFFLNKYFLNFLSLWSISRAMKKMILKTCSSVLIAFMDE